MPIYQGHLYGTFQKLEFSLVQFMTLCGHWMDSSVTKNIQGLLQPAFWTMNRNFLTECFPDVTGQLEQMVYRKFRYVCLSVCLCARDLWSIKEFLNAACTQRCAMHPSCAPGGLFFLNFAI